MAYQRPIVLVFQEYARQSVATQATRLYPCIVGPCFHIIDVEDDPLLALAAHQLGESGLSNEPFPSNHAGAVIQEDSVSFKFSDVVVGLAASPFTASTLVNNEVGFATPAAYPAIAATGDYVKIIDTGNDNAVVAEGVRIIRADAANNRFYIHRVVTPGTGPYEITLTRKVEDFTKALEDIPGATVNISSETFSLPAMTVSVGGAAKNILSAKAYVGYKALRQDLSDVFSVSTIDEAEALLGKLVPDNPLGFGVSIALANTTTMVKLIGVDTENVAGYTAAKDRLETAEEVYSVVPLTQSSEILSILKSHADQMSLPEKGQWRVCLGNTPLLTAVTLETGSALLKNDDQAVARVVHDDSANFLSQGVDAGRTIEITDGDDVVHTFTVAEVVSEDMLKVVGTTPFTTPPFTLNNVAYSYVVKKSLANNKTAQAEAVKAVSESFGTSRFVHVWPDVCVIGGEELPGYYLCCTVAGMIGGLPSHQGLTRISPAGIGGIRHSNEYFNQEQLDIIADGGTFIFLQENAVSVPYIRHQLTTDMSTIEFRELSFVKNYDYVSYLCKDTLDKFLGKYNITPTTLGILETALRSVLESLRLYTLPRIGSPVLGYSITKVQQLDAIRDRVEMYAEIDFPYALNTIGLHLVSR